ncbi:MAG: aldo/keto reductase [Alphaproteobacteria bacterium]|nr:aldo/keto reductase [Alphaproteobacteria bacterium]
MPFNQRPIGTTGISVSTLGFGSASLAGNITEVSDEDARGAINRAIDAGITYFDTAPFYGYGRAERLVGDTLRPRREGTVLSTKAGRLLARFFGPRPATEQWQNPPPFVDVFDYSYDAIMRSVEDSYQRLGLNSIEIIYVHDIGTYTHGEANTAHFKDLADGGYRALEQLRASGDIKAIGLGTNEWQVMMDAFEIGEWDVFLLAGRYTLLEQTALSPFLDTCIKKNASVVVGGPFNSGILVGGTTWDYASAPAHIVDKVEKLEKTCAQFNVPLPAAALQFPLRHPAVASVIPGPRSVTEFDQILDWWKIDIKPELWAALKDQSLLDDDAPI